MQQFKVSLSRVYNVIINAKNRNDASGLVEFFIGDPKDESNLKEREEHSFSIDEIEMMVNDAIEVEELKEENEEKYSAGD